MDRIKLAANTIADAVLKTTQPVVLPLEKHEACKNGAERAKLGRANLASDQQCKSCAKKQTQRFLSERPCQALCGIVNQVAISDFRRRIGCLA
jgi:hypothetical protein